MRGTERNDRGKEAGSARTSLRRRSTMVIGALVAAVACGFPAVSIHQQASARLPAMAPAPAVAPALALTTVPVNTVPLNTVPLNTVPLNTVPLNTVPPVPAGSVPVPPVAGPLLATAPTSAVPGAAPASYAPAKPGRYGFEVVNADGNPARWNPCVAVHYVVNLTRAPPGAMVDLQHAVAILTQASGLGFVGDGTTYAALDTSWITSGPVGASGWPDVLIGWSDPAHTDLKLTQAMGGITEYEASSLPGGGSGLVAAVVVLSAPNDPGAGFGPNSRGALLLHELGHAVGLAHVNDPTQIMNPVSTGAPGIYGSGDLAGLNILGSGGCITAPARSQTDLGRS